MPRVESPRDEKPRLEGPPLQRTDLPPSQALLLPPSVLSQWDDLTRTLPTQQRVRDILAKMQTLDLLRLLPPKLEYAATPADVALQQNIVSLFNFNETQPPGPDGSKMNVVLNALLAVVSRTDSFMTEAQRLKVDAARNNLNTEQIRLLQLFYPSLMALIKALLVHCQNLAIQIEESSADKNPQLSVHKCVLEAWQQLIGELHDIHSIILFASKKAILDLGDFPTRWSQAVETMYTDIDHLRFTILNLKDSLNTQLARLNERDKKVQQILSQYADVDLNLQLLKAQKSNTITILDNYTSVVNLVHENMARQNAAFPG
jgi:hypothetical protein